MRSRSFEHATIAKWFFILLSATVLFLYWKVMEPYALVLVTAGIFTILLTPLEKRLREWTGHPKVSTLILVLMVLAAIVLPVVTIGLLMIQQASGLAQTVLDNREWLTAFHIQDLALFQQLPSVIQAEILKIDLAEGVKSVASWASSNIQALVVSSADFAFKTFIFFVALYYMLHDRERIVKRLIDLSPLRDKTDQKIIGRIVNTVRGVIIGSLTVAVVQGIIAGIGLMLFGVPAPLIWAGLVVIAANVPMIGTGAIMLPAVAYLFLIGDVSSAVGLLIWSSIAVGLVDNILQPFIVGGRTRMNALLILLSMLGGMQAFGPIGFILGPTILAAFLIVLELYRSGILEKQTV